MTCGGWGLVQMNTFFDLVQNGPVFISVPCLNQDKQLETATQSEDTLVKNNVVGVFVRCLDAWGESSRELTCHRSKCGGRVAFFQLFFCFVQHAPNGVGGVLFLKQEGGSAYLELCKH